MKDVGDEAVIRVAYGVATATDRAPKAFNVSIDTLAAVRTGKAAIASSLKTNLAFADIINAVVHPSRIASSP